MPTLLQQMLSRLCSLRGMAIARIVFVLLSALAYLLSPFDLIPESVFGVVGLVDDLLYIAVCLFIVGRMFYNAYSTRFVHNN